MSDVEVTKPKTNPREKWMGITRVVKAQGYKSEITRKYGSVQAFTKMAGIHYGSFNAFLNGRLYWKKKFAEICESYLYGDCRHILPDLVYKKELDAMRSEIKFIWGSVKAMGDERKFVNPDEVYSLMSNLSKGRKKGRVYWQIRCAIAEKKFEILKASR